MLGAVCDCSSALGNDVTELKHFVGSTCEIEVRTQEYCTGPGNEFCVNSGNCRVTAANFTKQPCKCPLGFAGRHCQYADADVQADCLLKCSNHGTCEHGKNPDNEKGVTSILGLEAGGTSMFQHCVCHDGFAGSNCEYKATQCGERNRFCFHGSKCVEIGGGSKFGGDEFCECSTDNDEKRK